MGKVKGMWGNFNSPPDPLSWKRGGENLGWVEITWIPFQLTPSPSLKREGEKEDSYF